MATAQNQQDIAGEYYLHGLMETASGFKLDADSVFHFFFSYGALDRYGKGRWILKDGNVVLNSRTKPGRDFSMFTNKVMANDSITIRVTDKNEFFLSHVYCIIQSGNKKLEGMCDKQGYIRFPQQAIDSIELIFEFCAERVSVFNIVNKADNYFEFKFEPWIMEVFFENFVLKPGQGKLTGNHPLLEKENYDYIKSK